jgi:cytochrome P450
VGVMQEETERALAGWSDGGRIDLYHWTRELALRIAMRALFGFDPDRASHDVDAAAEFERALGFYGHDYVVQSLRGPWTPWRRMQLARAHLDVLILGEIARRRATGERGEDILSLLLDAEDEDGDRLTDQLVRDEVMTLLFAGHDTTTATVCFLMYELAGAPAARDRLLAERDAVLGDRRPSAAELMGGEALPELEMALDETLRLWPPAWVGPRRSVAPFELHGHTIPGGVPVNYSSWVSHRLPDVWAAPDAFRPERFAPEARARIPKGAYVPFGGGSRTCIGMRFGQLEIRAIAARLLRDFTVQPEEGWRLEVRQTPTLGPRGGMPVRVRARTGDAG